MTPTVTLHDMTNVSRGASHFGGDLPMRITLHFEVADAAHVALGQVRGWVGFATMLAAFSLLVFHVARVRIEEQVIRVNAARVVAPVAHLHVNGRPFAIVQVPCYAVGAVCLAAIRQFAIAFGVRESRPQPTGVKALWRESLAETFTERSTDEIGAACISFFGFARGIMGLHENLLILVPGPRTLARRWDNFIGRFYSFILPQMNAFGNAKLLEAAYAKAGA